MLCKRILGGGLLTKDSMPSQALVSSCNSLFISYLKVTTSGLFNDLRQFYGSMRSLVLSCRGLLLVGQGIQRIATFWFKFTIIKRLDQFKPET